MRTFHSPQPRPALTHYPLGFSRRLLMPLALCAAGLTACGAAAAQTAPWKAEPSSLCGRDNAVEMVRQQADAAKNFDDNVKRIAVLLRAADLLWPSQQQRARAAFAEAFEVAEREFKEKGDEPKKVGLALLAETPDQRYTVIRAVARRDPAWAKRLTDDMLKKERQEAEEAAAKNPAAEARAAGKLLDSAISFLASDPDAANHFAAASLRLPASLQLTRFLYKLAETDQGAADRFYRQAFAAYGERPLREFLYLAAYPFGLTDAGDMPLMGSYNVPRSFAPDPALRALFVQTLLRRARQTLDTPPDEGDNYNGLSAAGHILEALTEIEPHVRKHLPDLSGPVQEARDVVSASLSPETLAFFSAPEAGQDSALAKTFDERVDAAGREANADRRDELLATAILGAGPAESLESVVKAADKIADSKVRSQILEWVYFGRAQRAVSDKQFAEARALASKVQEADQRAYLYSEIARESLRGVETQAQARELLDEIVATAAKGPDTTVTARALFSAAYLYSKIDPGRSIAVLGDAVKLVNRMESPDFSRQQLTRKIEGKNFARYASFKTPGFDPVNAFREMAGVDFDGALFLANGIGDKSLRALTMLDLADTCLRRADEREKAEAAKKKVKR